MLSYNQDHHSNVIQQQQLQHQIHQQQSSTLRLRDISTPLPRSSRKRKSSPEHNNPDASHPLPPPHALVHPSTHMQGPPPTIPHGYQYAPSDYSPAGLPPHPTQPPPPHGHEGRSSQSPPANSPAGRALSSSKRAEQNRKAQRAFRERRDQHVKALESRSQLLDAALASADEANRRWEECRALVDQLRIENTALRAALGQSQMLPPGTQSSASAGGSGARASHSSNNHGAHPEEARNQEGSNEFKNNSGEAKSDANDQA